MLVALSFEDSTEQKSLMEHSKCQEPLTQIHFLLNILAEIGVFL